MMSRRGKGRKGGLPARLFLYLAPMVAQQFDGNVAQCATPKAIAVNSPLEEVEALIAASQCKR